MSEHAFRDRLFCFVVWRSRYAHSPYWRARDRSQFIAADQLTWCVTSVLGALAIPSGTYFGEPYYLLSPAIFWFTFAALAGEWAEDQMHLRAQAAGVALVCVGYSALLVTNTGKYHRILRESAEVRRLLRTISEEPRHVTVVYRRWQPDATRFFDPPENPALQAFSPVREDHLTVLAVADPNHVQVHGVTYILDDELRAKRSDRD